MCSRAVGVHSGARSQLRGSCVGSERLQGPRRVLERHSPLAIPGRPLKAQTLTRRVWGRS